MATMASVAPRSSNSNSTSHWTIRDRDGLLCKSRSVVQSLFLRELGYPYFSQNGDCSSTVITRQLFDTRSLASNETGRVKATKVELIQKSNGNRNDEQVQWTQISVPEKTEISITDNRVWTRRKLGNARANANSMAKEDFYSVEPCSGLKCVKSIHSTATGKLKSSSVFLDRVLGAGSSTTHFLTLIEPGILRAYDLVKNQLTDEFKLPTDICQGLTGYTEMDVFDNSRKLFIMGTGKTLTKVIVVLNYPPWKKMSLIHVEFPVQITMSQGVCFFLQGKHLQISTWKMLLQKITRIENSNTRSRLGSDQPSIQFEGKLSELPTIISKIQLSNNKLFGLMDINSVPMFYGAVKTGMNIFTFHETPKVVEEFITTSEDAEDPIEIFPFPDGSSKALMCTRYSAESKIVEFQTKWVENQREAMNSKLLESFSFENYWKNLRQNARSTNPASTERRPKRKCVNNNVSYAPKISILGLTYCATMDLIAVLTADDEEFQVAVYEPMKLDVVKALPPVYAWPKVNDDVNQRRESINSVEFIFEPDFVFIGFHYSAGCKPPRDVFFTRLLAERD